MQGPGQFKAAAGDICEGLSSPGINHIGPAPLFQQWSGFPGDLPNGMPKHLWACHMQTRRPPKGSQTHDLCVLWLPLLPPPLSFCLKGVLGAKPARLQLLEALGMLPIWARRSWTNGILGLLP